MGTFFIILYYYLLFFLLFLDINLQQPNFITIFTAKFKNL